MKKGSRRQNDNQHSLSDITDGNKLENQNFHIIPIDLKLLPAFRRNPFQLIYHL